MRLTFSHFWRSITFLFNFKHFTYQFERLIWISVKFDREHLRFLLKNGVSFLFFDNWYVVLCHFFSKSILLCSFYEISTNEKIINNKLLSCWEMRKRAHINYAFECFVFQPEIKAFITAQTKKQNSWEHHCGMFWSETEWSSRAISSKLEIDETWKNQADQTSNS